jgi:pimeloyl-ACP methyl ester carboxylesterase
VTDLTQDLTVDDGRTLDVLVGGAVSGPTIVLHHGTPSDATTWSDWHEDAERRGVRIVSVSRPGYASSTRQRGREVADAAADVAAVLDLLGIDEYVTAGWSGGGPHALACAALHPDRCRAAAILAGAAPYGVPGLDFLDGMGPENVEEFSAALQGEPVLRAWLTEHGQAFRHVTGAELAEALGGLVPDIDKAVLQSGFAVHMAAEIRRALAGGFDGWIDDDLAFVRPWGFELEGISVPVTVWQGDLDLMIPASHGTWLVEHLPTAQARTPRGHGHISLVTEHRLEVLDWLLVA